MTKIRFPAVFLVLACVLAEVALVVGLSYGIGTWLHHEFGYASVIPPSIDGIDRDCVPS